MSAVIRRQVALAWILLFILSVLLQYAQASTPAHVLAATGLKAGTVQGFEIDGDLKCKDASLNPGAIPAGLVDGGLPMADGDDWLDNTGCNGVVDPPTPPTSELHSDPISSQSDDVFTQGSKELDTRTWTYTTSKPTPKDDLRHVMAYAKFVGTSAFFYMGAERIVNNGSTHLDFELNAKPFKTWSDGLSKVNRSNGDLLVSLDFSNGGSNPEITVYEFLNVVTFASGQTADINDITSSAAVHSATNFVDLANAGFGYTIPSFEFAEASIDLASLGISTSCPGLSSGFIRTRSGDDPSSSELKDKIAPLPIDLNNCGKLRIEKHAGTIGGALLAGATFTVDPNPIPGGSDPLTIQDNGTGDSNSANGIIDISPAEPGDYTVCETIPPPGYNLPSPACQDVTVPPNGTFADATVKFADPPKVAATELVVKTDAPAKVYPNDSIHLVVTETNTGESALHNVTVTGTNSCANWTPVGIFDGTLDPAESQDFDCTFNAPADDFSWTATGHGTDELGNPVPGANETIGGDVEVLNPATTLTLVSEDPDPVVVGGTTTITVNEKNTGDDPLTDVNVTGSPCASWTPVDGGFNGNLGVGESEDFTCVVSNVGAANVDWTAVGHGKDSLGNDVPADNESVAGSVHVVNPSIDLVKTAGSTLDNQAADGTAYETLDGSTVVYKYVVTTQDPDGLTNVSVTDDLCSPVTAVTSGGHNVGDTNGNDKLEPGESWVFECSRALTIAADGSSVHNIGTAHGTPSVGPEVTDTDDALVILRQPTLTIEKAVVNNTVDRGTAVLNGETAVIAQVGDTLNYTLTYTVTNGPVTNAFIDDVLPVGLGTPTNISGGGTYDPATHTIHWDLGTLSDGTYTQTYQVVVIAGADGLPQPLVNVATIDSDETPPDSDDALVAIVPVPLTITLPPTATLGRPSEPGDTGNTMLILMLLTGAVTLLGVLAPSRSRLGRRGRRMQ